MYAKVLAFIQKIPAWILLFAGAVTVYGPDVLSFETLHEPQAVAITRKIFAGIALLALLIKQSSAIAAKGDSPIAVAEVQKVVAAKAASIHPPPLPPMSTFFLVLCSLFLLLGLMLPASTGCQGAVSPNTVQTVLTVEQYACVTDQLLTALLPSGSVQQVASAIQQACSALIPQSLTSLIVDVLNAILARHPDAGPSYHFGRKVPS